MWYWYRAHWGRDVSRKWLVLSLTMMPEEPGKGGHQCRLTHSAGSHVLAHAIRAAQGGSMALPTQGQLQPPTWQSAHTSNSGDPSGTHITNNKICSRLGVPSDPRYFQYSSPEKQVAPNPLHPGRGGKQGDTNGGRALATLQVEAKPPAQGWSRGCARGAHLSLIL